MVRTLSLCLAKGKGKRWDQPPPRHDRSDFHKYESNACHSNHRATKTFSVQQHSREYKKSRHWHGNDAFPATQHVLTSMSDTPTSRRPPYGRTRYCSADRPISLLVMSRSSWLFISWLYVTVNNRLGSSER